jgi:hypothetical protein
MATVATGEARVAVGSSGVVFDDVTWEDYEAMLRMMADVL